jgi:hypothetical protein
VQERRTPKHHQILTLIRTRPFQLFAHFQVTTVCLYMYGMTPTLFAYITLATNYFSKTWSNWLLPPEKEATKTRVQECLPGRCTWGTSCVPETTSARIPCMHTDAWYPGAGTPSSSCSPYTQCMAPLLLSPAHQEYRVSACSKSGQNFCLRFKTP